jgi:type II secretory pathway component GspD/PulD (secretin)
MRIPSTLALSLTLIFAASLQPARAQTALTSESSTDSGVPLAQLIATIAKKTGKKFVVDPRVRGGATLIGQDTASINYAELVTILEVNGFAAVEGGGYVRVVPEATVRQLATPIVSGKETLPDSEYVTRLIPVKSLPAGLLVPILRPLLPQQGHLAAEICTNTLMMVDTFANTKRIEAMVQTLDKGEPYRPQKCEPPPPLPPIAAPRAN